MSALSSVKLTPKQNIVAGIFIVIILVALALRLYASNKELTLAGPHFLVSNNTTVLVVYNSDIYQLDPSGNIVQKIPFSILGITSKVADIQLLDDNRFVIGDWDNMRILLCHLTELTCQLLIQNLSPQIRNFFKFHFRLEQNDLFIADTDRHRILHYDIDSDQYQVISRENQFKFPNHITMEQDGFLYVTNTNRHRVSYYRFSDDSLTSAGKPFRVKNSISSKNWPVFHYHQQNNDLYLLQGNNFLKEPDLIHFPTAGEAHNIPLPVASDVTAIAPGPGTLLMCDRALFKIYSYEPNTQQLSVFGSPALNELFATDRETTLRWGYFSTAMLVSLLLTVIAMVLFISQIIIKARQQRIPIDPQSHAGNTIAQTTTSRVITPIVPGKLVWLDQNQLVQRLFTALLILLPIFAFVFYALINLLNIDLFNPEPGTIEYKLSYIIYTTIIVFIIVILNAYINTSTRIGTDGIYIYIKNIFGQKKLAAKDIIYSNHYLCSGPVSLVYRNNYKQYFHDKIQFESYITPLLETRAKKVGILVIFLHMIKHPNLLGLVTTLTMLFALIVTTFLFYKDLLP